MSTVTWKLIEVAVNNGELPSTALLSDDLSEFEIGDENTIVWKRKRARAGDKLVSINPKSLSDIGFSKVT